LAKIEDQAWVPSTFRIPISDNNAVAAAAIARDESMNGVDDADTDRDSCSEDDVEPVLDLEDFVNLKGLGTNLHPKEAACCGPQSPELEAFLKDVKRALLIQMLDSEAFAVEHTTKSTEMKQMMKNLADESCAAAPTDKVNSFHIVEVESCKKWVTKHL